MPAAASSASTSSSLTGAKSSYQRPTPSSLPGIVWHTTSSASPCNIPTASGDPTGAATTIRAAPAGAQRPHGCEVAEPGREAVVHDQDRVPPHISGLEVVAETLHLPSQLVLLAFEGLLQRIPRQARPPGQPPVDDGRAAFGHRADRELAVAGGTELAHDEHLERRPQPACHLGRHRNPSTREPEHERVGVSQPYQRGGKFVPCMGSVLEHHCQRPSSPTANSATVREFP